MTKTMLLDALTEFTRQAVKDLILPVRVQKGDTMQSYRAADVYKMRLPDSSAATKKAPYIVHQVIGGKDVQAEGSREDASATIRTIFCVYADDEQEGGLMLLELMERLRISLLRQVVIGKQFSLDLTAGVETISYPDDTAPYFAGEMSTVWKMPAVEREVNFHADKFQS